MGGTFIGLELEESVPKVAKTLLVRKGINSSDEAFNRTDPSISFSQSNVLRGLLDQLHIT